MKPTLLTIDIGNTHQTIGVHKQDKIVEIRKLIDVAELMHFEGPVLVSQVGPDLPLPFPRYTRVNHYRKDNQFLGMKTFYEASLGEDRLALSYYCYQYLKKNKLTKVMAIDAGTFTTVDLIDTSGHLGGHIFPGPNTLGQSYSGGKNLRVLPAKYEEMLKTPQKTEDAIAKAMGLMIALPILEIEKSFQPELVFLAGGAASTLSFLKTQQKLVVNLHECLKCIHDSASR